MFSQENADNIQNICLKNKVGDNVDILEITKNVGHVFCGLLPPANLADAIGKDAGIEKAAAENIASEITRFVFMPQRNLLEALYNTKLEYKTPGQPEKKTETAAPITAAAPKAKTPAPYREPLE